MADEVAAQARTALAEADMALFVVDAKAGVMPGDLEVAEILRREKLPLILVANKADGQSGDVAALVFHELGLGDPMPVSAIHGSGSDGRRDACFRAVAAPRSVSLGRRYTALTWNGPQGTAERDLDHDGSQRR